MARLRFQTRVTYDGPGWGWRVDVLEGEKVVLATWHVSKPSAEDVRMDRRGVEQAARIREAA